MKSLSSISWWKPRKSAATPELPLHRRQELIWCFRVTNLPCMISCVVLCVTVFCEKNRKQKTRRVHWQCNVISQQCFAFVDTYYIYGYLISLKIGKFKSWKACLNWKTCQFFIWREYVKIIFIAWKDKALKIIPYQSMLI